MPRTDQTSFAGGEISPELYGRIDLARYRNSLAKALNVIVHPEGGVSRRPGTFTIPRLPDGTLADYAGGGRYDVRLFPIQLSSGTHYVLLLAPGEVRLYRAGLDPLAPTDDRNHFVALAPASSQMFWASGDMDNLVITQDGDTAIVSHPSHAPVAIVFEEGEGAPTISFRPVFRTERPPSGGDLVVTASGGTSNALDTDFSFAVHGVDAGGGFFEALNQSGAGASLTAVIGCPFLPAPSGFGSPHIDGSEGRYTTYTPLGGFLPGDPVAGGPLPSWPHDAWVISPRGTSVEPGETLRIRATGGDELTGTVVSVTDTTMAADQAGYTGALPPGARFRLFFPSTSTDPRTIDDYASYQRMEATVPPPDLLPSRIVGPWEDIAEMEHFPAENLRTYTHNHGPIFTRYPTGIGRTANDILADIFNAGIGDADTFFWALPTTAQLRTLIATLPISILDYGNTDTGEYRITYVSISSGSYLENTITGFAQLERERHFYLPQAGDDLTYATYNEVITVEYRDVEWTEGWGVGEVETALDHSQFLTSLIFRGQYRAVVSYEFARGVLDGPTPVANTIAGNGAREVTLIHLHDAFRPTPYQNSNYDWRADVVATDPVAVLPRSELTAKRDATIDLSWSDPAPGVDHFEVFQSTGGGFGLVGRTQGPATSFRVQNLVQDESVIPPAFRNPFEDGNPICSGVFQQRSVFAGFPDDPRRIEFSRLGDRDNFDLRSPPFPEDGASVSLFSQSLDQIRHLRQVRDVLVAMTSNSFWTIRGNREQGVTPNTLSARVEQSYGVARHVAPLEIGSRLLFASQEGDILRETQFNFDLDGYRTAEASLYFSHLMSAGGIRDIRFVDAHIPLLIVLLEDGRIVCVTYEPDEQVVSAAVWEIRAPGREGFPILAICPTENANGDRSLFMSVERGANLTSVGGFLGYRTTVNPLADDSTGAIRSTSEIVRTRRLPANEPHDLLTIPDLWTRSFAKLYATENVSARDGIQYPRNLIWYNVTDADGNPRKTIFRVRSVADGPGPFVANISIVFQGDQPTPANRTSTVVRRGNGPDPQPGDALDHTVANTCQYNPVGATHHEWVTAIPVSANDFFYIDAPDPVEATVAGTFSTDMHVTVSLRSGADRRTAPDYGPEYNNRFLAFYPDEGALSELAPGVSYHAPEFALEGEIEGPENAYYLSVDEPLVRIEIQWGLLLAPGQAGTQMILRRQQGGEPFLGGAGTMTTGEIVGIADSRQDPDATVATRRAQVRLTNVPAGTRFWFTIVNERTVRDVHVRVWTTVRGVRHSYLLMPLTGESARENTDFPADFIFLTNSSAWAAASHGVDQSWWRFVPHAGATFSELYGLLQGVTGTNHLEQSGVPGSVWHMMHLQDPGTENEIFEIVDIGDDTIVSRITGLNSVSRPTNEGSTPNPRTAFRFKRSDVEEDIVVRVSGRVIAPANSELFGIRAVVYDYRLDGPRVRLRGSGITAEEGQRPVFDDDDSGAFSATFTIPVSTVNHTNADDVGQPWQGRRPYIAIEMERVASTGNWIVEDFEWQIVNEIRDVRTLTHAPSTLPHYIGPELVDENVEVITRAPDDGLRVLEGTNFVSSIETLPHRFDHRTSFHRVWLRLLTGVAPKVRVKDQSLGGESTFEVPVSAHHRTTAVGVSHHDTDNVIEAVNGTVLTPVIGPHEYEGSLEIVEDMPFPFHLLAVSAEYADPEESAEELQAVLDAMPQPSVNDALAQLPAPSKAPPSAQDANAALELAPEPLPAPSARTRVRDEGVVDDGGASLSPPSSRPRVRDDIVLEDAGPLPPPARRPRVRDDTALEDAGPLDTPARRVRVRDETALEDPGALEPPRRRRSRLVDEGVDEDAGPVPAPDYPERIEKEREDGREERRDRDAERVLARDTERGRR